MTIDRRRWSLRTLAAAAALVAAAVAHAESPRTVEIGARRFEFTPREVRLQKDQPVTLRITSADVTHGLYMKELGIDTEIVPGKTTEVTITPRKAGRFTAICDHFCGSGHGNMHLELVVE